MKEKKDKKRISFAITEELLEKVDIFAKENALNSSAAIRLIVTEFLDKEE